MPQSTIQRVKSVVHGVQGLFILIAFALLIAVFTQPGTSDGRVKYGFVLVSLSSHHSTGCKADESF